MAKIKPHMSIDEEIKYALRRFANWHYESAWFVVLVAIAANFMYGSSVSNSIEPGIVAGKYLLYASLVYLAVLPLSVWIRSYDSKWLWLATIVGAGLSPTIVTQSGIQILNNPYFFFFVAASTGSYIYWGVDIIRKIF